MKSVVNLLPERLQQQQLIRHHAIYWATAWAVCLAVGTGVCLRQRTATQLLRNEAAAAEASFSEIQTAVRDGDAIQARIHSLTADRRRYRSLANGHVPLALLRLLGRSARATAGRLRLESLGAREVSEASEDSTRVTLDIEGTALSDQAIAGFVTSLRTSGVFASVVLQSSRGNEGTQQSVRRFRLQCVLFGQAEDGERRAGSGGPATPRTKA